MMSRTRRLGVVAVVALLLAQVAVAPASAGLISDTPETTLQKYNTDGSLSPSYVVDYDANETASLKDWANASDGRRLISTDEDAETATVAAPEIQITGVWTTVAGVDIGHPGASPLSEKSYIDDVHPNYQLSIPEQPGAQKGDNFETPTVGRLSFDDPDFATEGMAFSGDVNETTLEDARATVGKDNLSADGAGRTTAVIDTGANVRSCEGATFGNGSCGSPVRILNASKNFVADGQPTVNESGFDAISDGSGHGTWTAAAIGANNSGTTYDGVAPDSDLLVLKALADDGSGSVSDIASAIRYAADHNVDVISMSLGSKVYSEPIEDAIAYAHDQGSIVVVAAGNSRMTSGAELASPGDFGPAITVGATTTGDGLANNVSSAYFSQVGPEPSAGDLGKGVNVGTTPDVAAPGFKLTAEVPDTSGTARHSTLSGTSMATPLVAGALVAAMSTNSTLATANASAVHDSVTRTARAAPNAAVVEVGHGIVSADNLADGTDPSDEQEDVMIDAASQRDTFYRAQSDAGIRNYLARIGS